MRPLLLTLLLLGALTLLATAQPVLRPRPAPLDAPLGGSSGGGVGGCNIYTSMTSGTWLSIPRAPSSVKPSPALTGGATGVNAVISAWGGGAYDTTNHYLYLWGGGHNDYPGNEIYRFDMVGQTWARVWGPTPATCYQVPAGCSCAVSEVYSGSDSACPPTPVDGCALDPKSRHTYTGLQWSGGKITNYGGLCWSASGGGGTAVWSWDPGLLTWTQKTSKPAGSVLVPLAVTQPNGHLLIPDVGRLWDYAPSTDTWTQLVNNNLYNPSFVAPTAAYDTVASKMVIIDGRSSAAAANPTTYQVWEWNNSVSPPVLTQKTSTSSCDTVMGLSTNHRPGLAWDSTRNRLLLWGGGTSVWTISSSTYACTEIPASAANTVTPDTPTAAGIFGRWFYDPTFDVFGVVNSFTGNVYVYKP